MRKTTAFSAMLDVGWRLCASGAVAQTTPDLRSGGEDESHQK